MTHINDSLVWEQDPKDEGQIVDVWYYWLGDCRLFRREVDRSDGELTYLVTDLDLCDGLELPDGATPAYKLAGHVDQDDWSIFTGIIP